MQGVSEREMNQRALIKAAGWIHEARKLLLVDRKRSGEAVVLVGALEAIARDVLPELYEASELGRTYAKWRSLQEGSHKGKHEYGDDGCVTCRELAAAQRELDAAYAGRAEDC